MAWRYRKSVKIGKNVRLNFSKSGVSTTIGGRGHSVNIGKNGTYVNRSIPGTGWYSRTKVSGGRSRKKKSSSSKSSSKRTGNATKRVQGTTIAKKQTQSIPPALREWYQATGETSINISIELDPTGNYLFTDATGKLITDAYLISIIRKTPQFKDMASQLKAAHVQEVVGLVEAANAQSELYTTLHKASADVVPIEVYEDEFDELELICYEPASFEELPPTRESVQIEVSEEADHEVKTLAVWKMRELREQYFNEHYAERYEQRVAEWQARKSKFETDEAQLAEELNQTYQQEYDRACARYENALAGDCDYIEAKAQEWFEQCELPVSISAQFEFRPADGVFMVDLDLPEIEDLPSETSEQLKNGNLKVKPKTQKALRAEYAQCVFGLGVLVASHLFDISPRIEEIVLSGYTQRRDKEGEMGNDYIYSIRFNRERFYDVDYETMDPESFCMSFENRCKTTTTKIFKTIDPYEE